MTSAWARRVASGCIVLASACKGGTDTTPPLPSDGGMDGVASQVVSFTFESIFGCASGGLCVPPSQSIALGIHSTRDTTLSLALEGAYADAALGADRVTTLGGVASVSLQTSSTAGAFTLVARDESDPSSVPAVLSVVVGESGLAILHIVPTYTGKRPNPAFLISIIQSTCNEVSAGAVVNPTWIPGPLGATLFQPVAAEEQFAVVARVHHYATGCTDVAPLAASVTRDVGIDVYDVPMAVAQTDMDAKFTPDGKAASSWQTAMTTAANHVAAGFFASSSTGKALLDAMRANVAAPNQAQFDASRTQGNWDTGANDWLSSRTPTIHDRAAAWLTSAAGLGLGVIVLHLGPGATGTATVTPTSVGDLSASLAGLATPPSFTWFAEADDTVHLAGSVTLSSSPYIGQLADAVAAKAVSSATDVAGAIGTQIDCAGMATSLVGTGTAYDSCDATCFASLCVAALRTAWSSALASPTGGTDAVTLSLAVGAPADVGENAEPQYFEGGWLGEVAGPLVTTPFAISGTAVGTEVGP